jgi:nucleoside 2-deoxyribosyltransferase-like protein
VYVEAPQPIPVLGRCVFLAGGITGCPDWQAEAVAALSDLDVVVLNPRRTTTPRQRDAAEQIGWEYHGLRRADLVLFWFPGSGSVQPIALYELGAHAAGRKPIVVGADPVYPRRADVVLQLSHVRPGLIVRDTLAATVAEARRRIAFPEREQHQGLRATPP